MFNVLTTLFEKFTCFYEGLVYFPLVKQDVERFRKAAVDPGFPNLLFGRNFPGKCMKMKDESNNVI